MMLCDLRRCRMADAVLALLRSRAAAFACLLHCFHCNAAASRAAIVLLSRNVSCRAGGLLELLPGVAAKRLVQLRVL